MIKKVKIAISGSNGKMGRALIKAIEHDNNILLGAALVKKSSAFLGKDIGEISGINKKGVICNYDLKKVSNNFDVLIDFTTPKNTLKNLLFCCENNKMIVIGTTGFNKIEKKEIKKASSKIGIVFSPNFSIGINLLLSLVKKTAKIMGNNSDIEIIETHHRNKLDAPSGTAISIGQTIANGMKCNFDDHVIFLRNNTIRRKKDIGISSIRAGKIIGNHSALFINDNESIEITHKAFNRNIFACGAIKAAIWIKNKKIGLHDMQDVLNYSYNS